jgi:anti-sigma factor RsiW
MDHLSIEVIDRYALRKLPADEIQRVEEHFAACPDCEDQLQDEVELPVAMRSSLVAEVREIIEAKRKKAAQRNVLLEMPRQ